MKIKFKKYDFKRGWIPFVLLVIYDFFLCCVAIGMNYVVHNFDQVSENFEFLNNTQIGAFTFSSFEMVSIIYICLLLFVTFSLFVQLWRIFFDWQFKFWYEDNEK